MSLLSLGVSKVEALCPHCKDTISGCAGGDSCPLVTDSVANAAIINDKALGTSPSVAHLLTHELAAAFTRQVLPWLARPLLPVRLHLRPPTLADGRPMGAAARVA